MLHVCLQVLTIQQEAFLDLHSYPWCPDIWQMAQLLAAGKAEPDVKDHTADLDMSGVALKTLLPDKTGFQLLVQPLRARGLGLRLKREYTFLAERLLGAASQVSCTGVLQSAAVYWRSTHAYVYHKHVCSNCANNILGMLFRWCVEEPLSDGPTSSCFSLPCHRPVAPHDHL